MTNTNIQHEAKMLIGYIVRELDGEFEAGTPDDWQRVLWALEDGDLLSWYFKRYCIDDCGDSQAIVEEAYAMVEKTIDGIKDEKAVKAQMRNALRSKFEETSKEDLIKGCLISAEITIGFMTFLASINTRYSFDSNDTDEMIGGTIDDLINDFVEEMDEDNLVVNL